MKKNSSFRVSTNVGNSFINRKNLIFAPLKHKSQSSKGFAHLLVSRTLSTREGTPA